MRAPFARIAGTTTGSLRLPLEMILNVLERLRIGHMRSAKRRDVPNPYKADEPAVAAHRMQGWLVAIAESSHIVIAACMEACRHSRCLPI